MGKCKANAIQTNLGTFRYDQTYPGIIQAYLEPCLAVTYLKLLFKHNGPEAYREPRHIHDPAIFRTLAYSKSKAYLES